MFDELFEQESYFDRIDEMRTYPDTERLDWTWARSRVNELLTAVGEIEAKNTRPPRCHLESYESWLLVELDSKLSLCWNPSDLERDQQAIKELMLKAMFLGSALKAGTLTLMARKGKSFTGNKRGMTNFYSFVLDLLNKHGEGIPAKRLFERLKEYEGKGLIDEVSDDRIFLTGKDKPIEYKSFENRLSELRKKLSP